MNALNGVQLDNYMLHTIILERSQNLINILPKYLILKVKQYKSKLYIKKIKKRCHRYQCFWLLKSGNTFHLCTKRKEKKRNLSLTKEKSKRHYILIKDFNTSMYDHTLHRGRKNVYRYCLQTFSTDGILKRHIKNCFKINGTKKKKKKKGLQNLKR